MNETDKPEDKRRVSGSVLSGLVMRVLATGKPLKLSEDEINQFHSDFADEVGPKIRNHRSYQRCI